MRFCVLGSGSGGNAIFVENGGDRLLIDAGFSATELGRRLESIDESLDNIDAIVVTHEHGDHIAGLPLAAVRAQCPVYVNDETCNKVKWKPGKVVDVQKLRSGFDTVVKSFTVQACRVPHDAVDPVAVKVIAGDSSLTIATDQGVLSDPMKELLRGSTAIILETNYDPYLLQNSPYNQYTRDRIASNYGHLSNEQAAGFIRNDFDGQATRIVIGHLSSRANLPDVARKAVLAALNDVGLDEDLISLDVATQDHPTSIFEV